MLVDQVLALSLFVLVASREILEETRREFVRDFSKNMRAECVVFLSDHIGDFPAQSATFQSMKLLSQEHLTSTLSCRTSRTSKKPSGRELQPCNRPLHVIQDENILRTAILYPGPTWLLFHNTSWEDVDLQGVDIRFDTQFLIATRKDNEIVLTEIYRVEQHLAVRSNVFGSWLEGSGVEGPKKYLYERRDVLEGLVMKVGIIHNVPFSYVKRQGDRLLWDGFVGRVWSLLEQRMNFTSKFILPPSGTFGNPLGNGSWDGLVGMLINKRVHCTGSALAPIPERFAFVEFSFALYTLHPRVFIQQPDGREATWTSFLLPFEPTLWLAFLAVGVAVTGVVTLTADASLPDAAFLAFTALFCQQSHVEKIVWTSAMVVDFLVQIVGLIALTCYGGLLYSNLAVSSPWMPFTSLEGLLKDNSYSFGIINNTYWNSIFDRQRNALFAAVHSRKSVPPPPIDAVEGYRRVCISKMAFVGTLEEAHRQRLNCTLAQLSDRMVSVAQSIAFPKNSPYRGIVDHNLMKLRSSGVLRLLWQSMELRVPVNALTEYPAIELEAVVPILAFATCGLSVALFVLMAEMLFARLTRDAVEEATSLASQKSVEEATRTAIDDAVKERTWLAARVKGQKWLAKKDAVEKAMRGKQNIGKVFVQVDFID